MLAVPQTSRLGLPKKEIKSKVINSIKSPIPSANYNNVFARPISNSSKRAGKLTGYGRISDKRNMSLFHNESVVMPM